MGISETALAMYKALGRALTHLPASNVEAQALWLAVMSAEQTDLDVAATLRDTLARALAAQRIEETGSPIKRRQKAWDGIEHQTFCEMVFSRFGIAPSRSVTAPLLAQTIAGIKESKN